MKMNNNINFRIVSSASKSQFLQNYSYYLKNINGEIFDECAKYRIILNYEYWFNFLNVLEQYFITTKSIDISYIITEMESVNLNIHNSIDANTHQFSLHCCDKIFCEITITLFKSLKELFINELLQNPDTIAFFSIATRWISLYLQSIVYIIYELQTIKTGTETPFISATDFYLEAMKDDFCFTYDRARIYNKYFKIKEFKIRNTTNMEIPKHCLDMFKENHFNIITIE